MKIDNFVAYKDFCLNRHNCQISDYLVNNFMCKTKKYSSNTPVYSDI